MKVILLEDVKKLGKKDEIVEVSKGYANNFLFKKNLAVEANSGKLNELKLKQGAQIAESNRILEEAKELANVLEGKTFTVKKKSGEQGRLYGALTSIDVAAALAEAGYEVNKRLITLKHDLKNIGSTEAELKLHNEVSCNIIVHVESL